MLRDDATESDTRDMRGTDLSGMPAPRSSHRGHRTLTLTNRWRQPWPLAVVLGIVLLAPTAIAYIIGSQGPSIYEARAEVLLSGESAGTGADERAMATQLSLLTSRPLLEPVARDYDMSVADLSSIVEAEQVGGSQIVQLSVRNEDPATAEGIAGAVVGAYVARRAGEDDKVEQRNYLNARIADLQAQLAAAPEDTEGSAPAQEVLINEIADLQARVTDVDLPTDAPAELLTTSYVLQDPVSPRPARSAAAGGLVGLLAAAGVAVVAARRKSNGDQ